jgi:hypothetical protein
LKFRYEFDLKNSAENMSIFCLHSEFKLVTTRSNINGMVENAGMGTGYRVAGSGSSIGKRGSGPGGAGGALELHPLRHQDIFSY